MLYTLVICLWEKSIPMKGTYIRVWGWKIMCYACAPTGARSLLSCIVRSSILIDHLIIIEGYISAWEKMSQLLDNLMYSLYRYVQTRQAKQTSSANHKILFQILITMGWAKIKIANELRSSSTCERSLSLWRYEFEAGNHEIRFECPQVLTRCSLSCNLIQ